jgi:hypothetical protein
MIAELKHGTLSEWCRVNLKFGEELEFIEIRHDYTLIKDIKLNKYYLFLKTID